MWEVDHCAGLEWDLLLIDGDESVSIEADHELWVALLFVRSDAAVWCELASEHSGEGWCIAPAEEVPDLDGALTSEEVSACLMRKFVPIHVTECSLLSSWCGQFCVDGTLSMCSVWGRAASADA